MVWGRARGGQDPPHTKPNLREGTASWQEGRQGSGCARWHTEALHMMYTCEQR